MGHHHHHHMGFLKWPKQHRHHEDSEAIIMAINEWIEEQHRNFFCEGITAL